MALPRVMVCAPPWLCSRPWLTASAGLTYGGAGVKRGDHKPPCCRHVVWTFAGADFKRRATEWRCPTGECQPANTWVKASRLHPLIPRESQRSAKLYGSRGAVEREFGRLKNEWALAPLPGAEVDGDGGRGALRGRRKPRDGSHRARCCRGCFGTRGHLIDRIGGSRARLDCHHGRVGRGVLGGVG